jgi:NAD+ synthase (glutamine-hydrolysing)
MRIALVQSNPVIGDLDANAERLGALLDEARRGGAELAVLPELCVCGYPPRDLLLAEGFVPACLEAAEALGRAHTEGITVVVGSPAPVLASEHREAPPPDAIANALLVYRDGQRVARYEKRLLPTYDVFDEDRYFEPGERAVVIEVPTREGPHAVGLAVCEDLWKGQDAGFASRYLRDPDPVAELARAGARTLVAPSASPFVLGKGRRHRDILRGHARRHGINVVSVNQVGGNDDLVFDGHSAAYDSRGQPLAYAPGFAEGVTFADVPLSPAPADPGPDPLLGASDEELLFRALVLGTRDYLAKTGHSRALVGLSGGIDSAVTCAIAAAALGPGRVLGVAMPGKYSSDHALADARDLAARLGVECLTVPIGPAFDGFRAALDPGLAALGQPSLGERLPDVAEENLQSRTRGTVMMTLSNRTGDLLLTTGNKSELAVGYCTLYGDMNGGLAVLSDVTKVQTYRLARWLNAQHARAGFAKPPIPESTIAKPPSAELAPDQRDEDSLPPYEVLDEIVERFVEAKQSASTIAREAGLDPELVRRVLRMIDRSEHKRKQTAVGIKVTGVAFGSGRRIPIAQRWVSP